MRRNFYILLVLTGLHHFVQAQDSLVFKGLVKCYISEDERSTRGAINVIVYPGFLPKEATKTVQPGYFELNTTIPLERLEGKTVDIYFVSNCNSCVKVVSQFISSDQARAIRGSDGILRKYVTLETVRMNAGCKQTEMDPLKANDMLSQIETRPSLDLNKVSGLNVVTASPALLNVVTETVTIPFTAVGVGKLRADTGKVLPGSIQGYGNFLQASPMVLSGNAGFNFSPTRNLSEAVFWNPSALGGTADKAGISFFNNFKNNFKLSGFKKINKQLTLGAGGLYTVQQEYRPVIFPGLVPPKDTVLHLNSLHEFAAFVSAGYRISDQLSVGLAIKYISQSFNLPDSLALNSDPRDDRFIDRQIRLQHADADLSITYRISPSWILGINLMNLAGTKLYSNAFARFQQDTPYRNLRSLGAGLTYKWRRLNVGTDVLLTDSGLYEITVGANWVPFNNGLISAGYALKQKGLSVGFRWKQFQLTYIDDNGLLVSQKKPGKSRIVDGRLYAGVIVEL